MNQLYLRDITTTKYEQYKKNYKDLPMKILTKNEGEGSSANTEKTSVPLNIFY